MTLETTSRLVIYRGNGATTVFAYTFPIPTQDDLVVSIQDYATGAILEVLSTSEYSVTGLGDLDGGEVTYNPLGVPLDDDFNIVIERLVEYKQRLELTNFGGFYPETLGQQLDYIVMQTQQLAEIQGRSLTVAPGNTPPDINSIYAAQASATASAAAASGSASAAATSEGNALSYRNKAEEWAENPEDDEVEPGQFSALHWAAKAAQVVLDGLVDGSVTAIKIGANFVFGQTAKGTPVDADCLLISDSAASNTPKKLTFASLKTWIKSWLTFSKEFESTEQTITAASAVTIPHPLGVVPKFITAELVCKTDDLGYTAGTRLEISASPMNFSTNSNGHSLEKDDENIYVFFGSTAGVYVLLHRTTRAITTITPARWKLVVKAFA